MNVNSRLSVNSFSSVNSHSSVNNRSHLPYFRYRYRRSHLPYFRYRYAPLAAVAMTCTSTVTVMLRMSRYR